MTQCHVTERWQAGWKGTYRPLGARRTPYMARMVVSGRYCGLPPDAPNPGVSGGGDEQGQVFAQIALALLMAVEREGSRTDVAQR